MKFTQKTHKNCRKFFKHMYDFEGKLSESFVEELSSFGTLTINRFSQIVPGANDMFKITNGELEITGVIGGNSIFLVVPKGLPDQVEKFEGHLERFLETV